MKNLLKHDFYRIFHSKLALISLIIVAAFALALPAIFFGLEALVNIGIDEITTDADVTLFGAQFMFGLSYSLSTNVGIIVPIFGSIFVISDIRQGSTRNKLIRGYKKIEIFSSQSIVSMSYILTIITTYTVLTFLFSSLFFGFPDLGNVDILASLGQILLMGTVEFIFVSSLVVFGAYVTKNIALTILIIYGFALLMTLLATLVSGLPFLEKYQILMDLIPTYGSSVLSGLGAVSGTDTDIQMTLPIVDCVVNIIATLGFSVLNGFLGFLVFNNRDVN